MDFKLVTLFPELFENFQENGVVGRAFDRGLVSLSCLNPRDFTEDVHRTVDDRPYGGGPGMVMKVEPLVSAIKQARSTLKDAKVVYLSPQGKLFNQDAANEMATRSHLILVAGRYEGIDERVIQQEVDEEWSIGDFVLSGGELPAMVMMDAIIRLLPGVLGHSDSAAEDSFMDGLLDYPHYTRPENLDNDQVPDVLLSGDHKKIKEWRVKQALGRTWQRRPDLLAEKELTELEQRLLDAFIAGDR